MENFAKINKIEILSFLISDKTIIYNGELHDNTKICYKAKLRKHQQHIAFPKNEVLIKHKDGREADLLIFLAQYPLLKFKKHDFIPNYYKIFNVANNEQELFAFEGQLKKQTFTKIAQVNYHFTLSATSVNDPLFNRQWSIKNTGTALQGNGTIGADMNVDSAWQLTTGNSNLKIAILDSGVDTLHADLIDNILPGFDAFADEDNDTKGYPTLNFSSDGHGTACAGIAAASGNNNLGVVGVAYTSKIVPIRIFFYQDYGSGIGVQPSTNTDALVSGSAYAWRVANADIMSTSAGLSPVFIFFLDIATELIEDEIEAAFNEGRNGKGVPMFFSAGNDDENIVLWPASLGTTIAVGASTMCDERKNPLDCSTESWGSSYGTSLDIVAPGTLVASTDVSGTAGYSNNDYTFTFNGTSAACPNAAGVGALILSARPDLHARDVKAILNLSAKKVDGYDFDTLNINGTWNEEVGYGRVNAFAALMLTQGYQNTVSINKLTKVNFVNVFPNPSNGQVNLLNESSDNVSFSIFSVDGKLIKQDFIQANSSIQINLASSLYLVKFSNNKGDVQVLKVLVL